MSKNVNIIKTESGVVKELFRRRLRSKGYDLRKIENVDDIHRESTQTSLFDVREVKICLIGDCTNFSKKDQIDAIKGLRDDIKVILFTDKVDKRKKIFKEFDIKEIDKEFNREEFINSRLNINKNAAAELIRRSNNSVDYLVLEVDKLRILNENHKKITKKDVEIYVEDYSEIDIWEEIDEFILGNGREKIEIYERLLKNGVDTFQLIPILYKKYRDLVVFTSVNANQMMAQEYGVNYFQQKQAQKLAYLLKKPTNFYIEKIKLLSELEDLIKKKGLDHEKAFKYFIIKEYYF